MPPKLDNDYEFAFYYFNRHLFHNSNQQERIHLILIKLLINHKLFLNNLIKMNDNIIFLLKFKYQLEMISIVFSTTTTTTIFYLQQL